MLSVLQVSKKHVSYTVRSAHVCRSLTVKTGVELAQRFTFLWKRTNMSLIIRESS